MLILPLLIEGFELFDEWLISVFVRALDQYLELAQQGAARSFKIGSLQVFGGQYSMKCAHAETIHHRVLV